MAESINQLGANQPERRKQINLRDIFDDVVRRVEPHFQGGAGLNGQSTDFWAAKAIREAHPGLSSQEVQTLTKAASRYIRER